jgi:hypothetical protein
MPRAQTTCVSPTPAHDPPDRLTRSTRWRADCSIASRTHLEDHMPMFMDVHTQMKGITREQLKQAHQADLDKEDAEQVHFVKAWADPESGKVFCLSEGPSKAAVQRVHKAAGHPADEIYEVPLVIE